MKQRLIAIVCVLMLAYGVRIWLDRAKGPAVVPRLEQMPVEIGEWRTVRDRDLPAETLAVLRADGVLVRDYEVAPADRVQLYIAYYRTQRAGESMHSPRNCLPGAGWEPVSSSLMTADFGDGRQEKVNRYLVQRDGKRMLVLYWYESRKRIIADEYGGKLYLLWDSLRRQDRDGAIVRISVPISRSLSEDRAAQLATHFVRSVAPKVTSVLFPATGS